MTSKKILIVDDDPDWREFLRLSLEELGYESSEASSGEEALEALHREPYQVMLLDLNMPGLSGAEVVQQLPPQAPRVVVLTSSAAADAQEALGAGAHYYLPKDTGRPALSLLLQALEA